MILWTLLWRSESTTVKYITLVLLVLTVVLWSVCKKLKYVKFMLQNELMN